MGKLDDALKKVKALKDELKKLTGENIDIFPESSLDSVRKAEQAVKILNKTLEQTRKEQDDLERGWGGIAAAINATVDEMKKASRPINTAMNSFSKMQSLTEKLKYDQQGLSKLSLSELKNARDKAKALQQNIKDQAKILKDKYASQLVDRNGNKLAGIALTNRLTQLGLSQKEYESVQSILQAQEDGFPIFNEINSKLDERIKKQKSIEKSLGVMGGGLKLMARIPIVGNFINASEAIEAANDAIDNGKGKVAAYGAAFAQVGKGILTSLNDPFVVGGLLIGALLKIKDILFTIDEAAEKYARSMNTSYSEALITYEKLSKITSNSLANAKDYMETLSFVGEQLGSNAQLNEKDLKTFTDLRKQAGLTNEELMGAQGLSLANGKSLRANADTILKTTTALNKQSGIYLNEKTILKDISKVSASITMSLGGSTEAITKTVVKAKQLGMELNQLESIQKSLLDFESSIEAELSAELLTGRDLNLETARRLALNNDLAGMAEQINNQLGGSAEFAKMNVIQQESMAEAVGMSREELAKTLFTQEQLKGLNEDEAARRQAVLDQRIQEVGLAQAQRELEEQGIEKLEKQAGVQTTINDLIERVKLAFAEEFLPYLEKAYNYFQSMVTEAGGMDKFVAGLVDKIKNFVSLTKTLLKLWISIKAAQLAYNAASAIGLAIQQKQALSSKQEAGAEITSASMKTFGTVPFAGIALAAAAAIATYASLSSLMNDGIIPPAGGSGYGQRVLFGPEGAISFNNKDTIVAGTNLGINKVNDNVSAPAGKLQLASNSNADIITAINSLKSRPIVTQVYLDGKDISKSVLRDNSNISSDNMSTQAYKTN